MISSLGAAARRFWKALPIDGVGFLGPADPDARWLIAFATKRRLRAIPRPAGLAGIAAARLLWPAKAVEWTIHAVRQFGFGGAESLRMFAHACLFGMRPRDAYVWRYALGAPRRPLPCNAYAKIQSSVGDPAQRALMNDKRAAAERLAARGIAVPELLAVYGRNHPDPVLPADADDMFVKPANGSRSRGVFAVRRIAPGQYRIGGDVCDEAAVAARLREILARGTLLIQRRVAGAAELAGLETDGAAPVLRLITAREPGGQPFLHSSLFSMRVPGMPASHPLFGHVRVPVSLDGGVLQAGYWFREPGTRLERSPWSGAPIDGQKLPGFAAAGEAVVAAAGAFDGLALIAWDVILSDAGPVILEGNAHCSWIFMTLARQGAPDAVPPLQLLRRWASGV
jgi:hypothetical protein